MEVHIAAGITWRGKEEAHTPYGLNHKNMILTTPCHSNVTNGEYNRIDETF